MTDSTEHAGDNVHDDDQEATETPTEPDPDDDTDESPSREAARYRHRAKTAEAERDAAVERLTALRKQVVEDQSGLHRPSALWAAGVDPDSVFDADGALDRDALTQAVTQASEQLGLRRAADLANHVPREGNQPDASSSRSSMVDVVMGNDER